MALFLNDTFTGTNGTNLESHAPDSGGSWIVGTGGVASQAQITSNRIYWVGTGDAIYYSSATPATADYAVQATWRNLSAANSGRGRGITLRHSTSAMTFYGLYCYDHATTPRWMISKRVAGVYTEIASYNQTLTSNTDYVGRLVARGTSLRAFVNGVLVIDTTDSAISAAGRPGVVLDFGSADTSSTGIHVDSMTAFDAPGAVYSPASARAMRGLYTR